MKNKTKEELTPDNSVAVPNDFFDKYLKIFSGKQLFAVADLIIQAYRAGLDIGRKERKKYGISKNTK